MVSVSGSGGPWDFLGWVDPAFGEALVEDFVLCLPIQAKYPILLSQKTRKKDGAPVVWLNNLSDIFVPVFQDLLQVGHELVGDCAVDEAVVVAQG